MGTYTTNKNLFMPTIGEQGWGTLVNGNFETIDTFLKPITVSGSTYTFSGNHVGNQSGGSISATSISNSGTSTFTGKITANGGIGTTSLTTSSTITSTGKITANGGIGTKALTATSISNSGTLTQTGTSTFTGKITANGGITSRYYSQTGNITVAPSSTYVVIPVFGNTTGGSMEILPCIAGTYTGSLNFKINASNLYNGTYSADFSYYDGKNKRQSVTLTSTSSSDLVRSFSFTNIHYLMIEGSSGNYTLSVSIPIFS